MLDPSLTVAIICGASQWPDIVQFDPAKAFRNTADAVVSYLVESDGLGLAKTNVLNLFDVLEASKQYTRIDFFLSKSLKRLGAPNGKRATIIFWYVGHGAFFQDRDYCLLTRGTRAPIERETSLQVATIAHILNQRAPSSARILILDCCFAGTAARLFQGGAQQAIGVQLQQVVERFPRVSILAAAGARETAILDDLDTTTLFGAALVDLLRSGDVGGPQAFSLQDLVEGVWRRLVESGHLDPPRPEVHSPQQGYGDLAKLPLFPNQAFKGVAGHRRALTGGTAGSAAHTSPKLHSSRNAGPPALTSGTGETGTLGNVVPISRVRGVRSTQELRDELRAVKFAADTWVDLASQTVTVSRLAREFLRSQPDGPSAVALARLVHLLDSVGESSRPSELRRTCSRANDAARRAAAELELLNASFGYTDGGGVE